MEVSQYYSMNDLDPEVLGCYKKIKIGEEVICKVQNNDQITGFYPLELNSEVAFGAMDNCGEIDDQIEDTGECNSETVFMIDRQEVEDQEGLLRKPEPERGIHNNQSESDSISGEIFGQIDDSDQCEKKAFKNYLVQWLVEHCESEDTDKILEYLEYLVQLTYEEIYQMFAGKGYGAETNQAIQDIPQSSECKHSNESTVTADEIEKYETSTERNESTVKMDMSDFLDDNVGTFSEVEIISQVGGENKVDGTTNEMGKTETSRLERSCLRDFTETNENAAEGNMPVIRVNGKGEEKIYEILYQNPWEDAYLSIEAVTKNEDTIKNVYVIQKDGKFLYKVRGREEDTLRESVHSGEVCISMILCAEIIEKKFEVFIVARKDGCEEIYNILDSKSKVKLVQPKNSKNNKNKTKKNDNKTKKKGNKHKKESTKKCAPQTVEKNIQRSLSETYEKEVKNEGIKENLTTVLGIMKTQENNACDKEELVKKFGLSKKREKTSAHKANTKVKIKKNKSAMIIKKWLEQDENKIKRKCKCGKRLPSNEEKSAIGNLVDYFVEEQISNLCFDFHRAAKFEHFPAREDVPKEEECYGPPDENNKGGQPKRGKKCLPDENNKGGQPKRGKKSAKKSTCRWHEGKCSVEVRIGLFRHLAQVTGEKDLSRGSKTNINYNESGGQQSQERGPLEIVLPPQKPTGPPEITTNSLFKQVLQDLENKEQLPKTKTCEEKGSTGPKPSKEKNTINRKPNNKKIASSLSENSKGQVENNKEESKKKMHGSNRGKASFSLPKKNRKDQEKDEEIEDFEKYQCCLKEDDEKAKRKIEELQIKIDQDLSIYRHLLEQKERIEKEETTSGCFSKNIEKVEEEHKNIESNKMDVEGISKNKEVDEIVDEIMRILKNKNIVKRKKKIESKKRKKERKPSEINEKKTVEWGNQVFQHKSKKVEGETTYLENKEPLPTTKICEEKGSTGQKLSKKKYTIKRETNLKKIACSLSENSKSLVENNKEESKKKMHVSNRGKASVSLPKKKRKIQEEQKNKETMEGGNEVFLHIIKKVEGETTYFLSMEENMIKDKRKSEIVSKQESLQKRKRKREESPNSDNSFTQKRMEELQEKLKAITEETKAITEEMEKYKRTKESKRKEKQSKERTKTGSVKRSKEDLKEKTECSKKRIEDSSVYGSSETFVKSVRKGKEKKTKAEVDSVSNPLTSLNNKNKELLILNQEKKYELKVGTDRTMTMQQNRKTENSKVSTKSNSSKPTKKSTKEKEEEKSNILDSASEDGSEEMDSDVSEYTPETAKTVRRKGNGGGKKSAKKKKIG